MANELNITEDAFKQTSNLFLRNKVNRKPKDNLTSVDIKELSTLIARLQTMKKANTAKATELSDYRMSIGIRELLMAGHISVASDDAEVEEITAAEFRRASDEARKDGSQAKASGSESNKDPLIKKYRGMILRGKMRVRPDTAPPTSVAKSYLWFEQKLHETPIEDAARVLARLKLRSEGATPEAAATAVQELLSRRENPGNIRGSDALVVARALHENEEFSDTERRQANNALRQIVTGEEMVVADIPLKEIDHVLPAIMSPQEAGAVRAGLLPENVVKLSDEHRKRVLRHEEAIFSGLIKIDPDHKPAPIETRDEPSIEDLVVKVSKDESAAVSLEEMLETAGSDDLNIARKEELEKRKSISNDVKGIDVEEERHRQSELVATSAEGKKILADMGIGVTKPFTDDQDEIENRIKEVMASSALSREVMSGRESLIPEKEKMSVILDYVDALKSWELAENANQADAVQYLLDQRLEKLEKLREMGAIGSAFLRGRDEDLKGDINVYLAADLEELELPEKGSPQWSSRKEKMADTRGILLNGLENRLPENMWNPHSNGGIAPQHFAEMTRKAAEMISGAEHIQDQRRIVDVMRQEVVTHTFRGQFILDVLKDTDNDGTKQSARDELLAGFGWSKAIRSESGAELEAVPMAEAVRAGLKAETGPQKLRQFQRMHALGKEIETNPPAVIALHDKLKGDEKAWNTGRAALIDQRFDRSILAEYRVSLSKDELKESQLRGRKADDPVRMFASAYHSFQKAYESGDQKMALAANVMRVSAKEILQNNEDIKALTGGSNELAAALLEFSSDREIELVNEMAEVHRTSLSEMVETQGLVKPSRKFTKDPEAGLNENSPLAIKAISGDAVRIANSHEELAEGKGRIYHLAGIVAPPLAAENEKGEQNVVLTKDKKVNAGQASHDNLVHLLSRFEAKHLSVEVVEGKGGEKCAQITMPGGRTLADEQIRLGYGLAQKGFGDTDRRHESLANRSRSERRGLNAHGMPEISGSWRSHDGAPRLSMEERQDRISDTVFNYFAGDVRTASEMLRRPETQFIALPLSAWSAGPVMEREMRAFVRENPDRAIELYENSCGMLDDLYERRKDKGLKSKERYATDYVNRGRAMMGAALAAEGEYDISDPSNQRSFAERHAEDLKKYPSLTEEARAERRDRMKQRMKTVGTVADKAARKSFSEIGRVGDTIMSIGEGLV